MLSGLLRGVVDLEPHRTGRVPRHVLWMPHRHLLLAGTRCPRPAMLNEAADTAANVGLDIIIVRDEIDQSFDLHTSFDIRMEDEKRWRCGYYLWLGELRVSPLGFVVVDRTPYANPTDWDEGLKRANAQLNRLAWER